SLKPTLPATTPNHNQFLHQTLPRPWEFTRIPPRWRRAWRRVRLVPLAGWAAGVAVDDLPVDPVLLLAVDDCLDAAADGCGPRPEVLAGEQTELRPGAQ
ncbi:MAG: hypothetical protein OXG34_03930, partial [bacterium]|nr:hypothetical protein [bacterium]